MTWYARRSTTAAAGSSTFWRTTTAWTCCPRSPPQFEALKAEAEKTLDVEITAAVELTEQQVASYAQALRQRFDQDVHVSVDIDPRLVGGAIVRAGDTVIDGSVRGRLTRLVESLQRN